MEDAVYIAIGAGPGTTWWPPHVFHFRRACAAEGGAGLLHEARVERYLIPEMNEYFPEIKLCTYCEMNEVYNAMITDHVDRLSGTENESPDEKCDLCGEIDPTVVRTPSCDNLLLCATCWRTVRMQIDGDPR